jgi:hypothetical protein
LVSVPARRKEVAYGWERGLSARPCTLFSVAQSALGYCSKRAVKDAKVVERMTALSALWLSVHADLPRSRRATR